MRSIAGAAVLLLSLALLVPLPATADAGRNTLALPDDGRYRPGVHPDRIVLVATEDPARSQAVSWRTGPGQRQATAQLAVAGDSPGLHLRARVVTGVTRPLESGNGLAHHHALRFEGLAPDTLYAYRVRGEGTWSEWLQFRTAPAEFRPFSFLYLGDAQNSVRSHFSRVIREAWRAAPQAALAIYAGDLVNLRGGNHDDEWGEWFEAGAFLHGMVPALPVAGNHEHERRRNALGIPRRELTPHWAAHFAVPRNGPPGHEDTVFFVRYPGVLFVALDSMRALRDPESATAQARWLDALLAQRSPGWVVVIHHHPVFSISRERDNAPLRELWKPVYDRHGVDLVLQGHDHAYGRGRNRPQGATVVGGRPGPVYVVSVAGPKMYMIEDGARGSLERGGEDLQLYQVVRVEARRLRYESRTAAGRLYDAFDIERAADGGKRFVERLRPGAQDRRCGNPRPPEPDECWSGTELVD